ncbi:MAG: hypothetical protein ACYC39_09520 [Thiobacillus sp.]
METKNKPGRPPKSGSTMTAGQRAATYRARRHEEASLAHEHLGEATTAVLMAGLARQLKGLSDPDHADTARYVATQLIQQLCDRHGIKLT